MIYIIFTNKGAALTSAKGYLRLVASYAAI
jgi:hypothetical protein